MSGPLVLGAVCSAIKARSYAYTTELELQDGLEEALAEAGFGVEREVRLFDDDAVDLGRVDLVVGTIGIEVKADGPASDVRRQLRRYTRSPRLDAVLLVTNRARHTLLGGVVNDKPIRVLHLVDPF